MQNRTAMIFCMGRELLEGAVLDRNANFMATHVTEAGYRVRTIQVLDDQEDEAIQAFERALELSPTFIFVTGGMGPGHDDITRQCVAAAAGVPLEVDETAKAQLKAAYRRLVARGLASDAEINDERLQMATVPQGSTCFENPIGTAPAVQFRARETTFFLMPGQPEELRRMFVSFVVPVLQADGPDGHRLSAQVEYPGGDESAISRMLSDLARRHPGVHPRARLQGTNDQSMRMRITLSAEGADKDEVQSRLDAAAADLRARLGLEVGGPTGLSLSE